LPVFEGPLDVLLRLIEREQLPISDVSLIAVFDQFMAFTRTLDGLRPEVIADFAAMAGRLSLLKSRSLLPRPPQPAEEADELDLARQLEAYRAIKVAAELLAEKQRAGTGAYSRGGSVAWPVAAPARLSQQEPSVLAAAVQRWLTRAPHRPVVVATQRTVSLREMIARITSLLERQRRVSFVRIRDECTSRHDVAVAFLALLTLLRRQAIVATQSELFGPISVERAKMLLSVAPPGAVEELHEANGNRSAGI
jgi:segregation and condensation protein A